jgi:enamine deaminase RidA (YjgF/YER057c/UK114 family)
MSRKTTNRRAFLAASLLGVAGVTSASAADTGGKAKITGITPEGAPAADGYSHGIVAEGGGKIIFVSGRGPRDRKADMETQIRQTLENVAKVLESAGASMKDVVILRGYFTNLPRDLAAYRKVRKEFFSKPYPASTSLGVSSLATADLQVEIEAVAIV